MSETSYHELTEFPGYRVGSDGSVWSKRRQYSRGKLVMGWHRLKLSTRKTGYVTACFRVGPKNYVRYVHHLVLEAFVGPCPEGMECCHGPGGASDNGVENVRWGTPEENDGDKHLHGRILRGDRHPLTKVSDRDIALIRFLAGEGVGHDILAAAFGVHRGHIAGIVQGRQRRNPACTT